MIATTTVGLVVPTPDWPVAGNSLPIALLFTAHMVVAQFGLGVITLAPIYEITAQRSGDPNHRRFARSLARAYYLSFSLGATLAVFGVTALIGLWGNETGTLVNRFLPLVGIAFGIFPVFVPLIVVYANTFDRMRPGAHAAIGVVLWFFQTLFVVLIVGIDAYLINPGHSGLLDTAHNTVYFPLLLHRLIGSVSWAALFVAGVAALRCVRAREEVDRIFHSWVARTGLRIGAATLLLMPPVGALLIATIHDARIGFFDNMLRGSSAWLFVVQSLLLGAIIVAVNVALSLELPGVSSAEQRTSRVAIATAAVGSVVGLLPSSVLGEDIYWVRYVGIGIAVGVTLAHLAMRTLPRGSRLALRAAPGAMVALPYAWSRAARSTLLLAGVLAAVLSLYMGFIKEEARGQYSIYGEMTQNDAHGPFNPQGVYP